MSRRCTIPQRFYLPRGNFAARLVVGDFIYTVVREHLFKRRLKIFESLNLCLVSSRIAASECFNALAVCEIFSESIDCCHIQFLIIDGLCLRCYIHEEVASYGRYFDRGVNGTVPEIVSQLLSSREHIELRAESSVRVSGQRFSRRSLDGVVIRCCAVGNLSVQAFCAAERFFKYRVGRSACSERIVFRIGRNDIECILPTCPSVTGY